MQVTAQFQLLRSRIESDVPVPAVIFVTSAQPGDGKSTTAHGLFECLSRVGHRVVLVNANAEAQVAGGIESGGSANSIIPVQLDDRGASASRAAISTFVRDMRDRFDFTIVDGAPFLRSNVAMLLAGVVDGVLLTVRAGRSQTEEDEIMARTLDHSKANVLGVVAVTDPCIADFRASQAVQYAGETRFLPPSPIGDDIRANASLAL